MKLSNMIRKPSVQKLNKVTESRFGFSIDYDAITLPKAVTMRNKIYETVSSIRNSSAIHTAEKNPQYLEMLIVYEGLSRWIDATQQQNARRKLKEGELGTAEAILAAKDMVDTCQDFIEKVGKMQNEQLPALIDSIRDQIGSAQADTFKNSVGMALTTLSQQLGQAREQLDSGARTLTGEQQDTGDMGMGGDAGGMGEPEMPPGMDDGMDGDIGDEAPPDEFGGADASAGGPEELGRERR
jgi:hypothetical protein